jgi:hypothetical protein
MTLTRRISTGHGFRGHCTALPFALRSFSSKEGVKLCFRFPDGVR